MMQNVQSRVYSVAGVLLFLLQLNVAAAVSRETLITGVCEGVSGTNYESYVTYNSAKSYYRDGTIIAIYTAKSGSSSLANCAKMCAMDWDTDGNGNPQSYAAGVDPNLAEEAFTAQQLCEAFVFNPRNSKCILYSGESSLNLRNSDRYFSGFLECPEPLGTYTQTILQPPGNVNLALTTACTDTTYSATVSWDDNASANGYIVTCFSDADPPVVVSTTPVSTAASPETLTGFSAGITYRCSVSSYTYNAVSKGALTNVLSCPAAG